MKPKGDALHIRNNSPNARKMTVDSSRPVRITNVYSQAAALSRKKLIAPFQKRQPSLERSRALAQKPGQAQPQSGKTPLYCLIKSSIQSGDAGPLNKTTVATKTVLTKENKGGNNLNSKGRQSCQDKILARNAKEEDSRRFFSRRDNLNDSKKRSVRRTDEVQSRSNESGSRLKERIQKFLYQPTEVATAPVEAKVKKVNTYSMLKGATIDRKKIKFIGVGKILPA